MRNNHPQRSDVEYFEEWRGAYDVIPKLKLKPEWEIKVIPPFGGAMARFIIYSGKANVSIYADFFNALGAYPGKYWEIYPNSEGDIERFGLDSVDHLLEAISNSLNDQNAPVDEENSHDS
jgi:hypothetical protein